MSHWMSHWYGCDADVAGCHAVQPWNWCVARSRRAEDHHDSRCDSTWANRCLATLPALWLSSGPSASTCPCALTCTLPRKLTTLRWGYLANSWAWRRRLADPTTAPSGSSDRSLAVGEMKTSRTSSRGRLQGKMVPSGRYVGTSCNHQQIVCAAVSACSSDGSTRRVSVKGLVLRCA